MGAFIPGAMSSSARVEIRAIRDLKGKSVGVPAMGSGHHVFLASMAAYVGLDPRKDINWVIHELAESAAAR